MLRDVRSNPCVILPHLMGYLTEHILEDSLTLMSLPSVILKAAEVLLWQ